MFGNGRAKSAIIVLPSGASIKFGSIADSVLWTYFSNQEQQVRLFADAWVKKAYDNWIYVIRYDGKVRSVLRDSIFTGDTQRQLNSWRKSICTEGSPFLVHRYFDCQFSSKVRKPLDNINDSFKVAGVTSLDSVQRNVGQAWRLLNIGRNFFLAAIAESRRPNGEELLNKLPFRPHKLQ